MIRSATHSAVHLYNMFRMFHSNNMNDNKHDVFMMKQIDIYRWSGWNALVYEKPSTIEKTPSLNSDQQTHTAGGSPSPVAYHPLSTLIVNHKIVVNQQCSRLMMATNQLVMVNNPPIWQRVPQWTSPKITKLVLRMSILLLDDYDPPWDVLSICWEVHLPLVGQWLEHQLQLSVITMVGNHGK